MSNYQQRLQQQFTDTYRRLNERQQVAVDTIEGPVMVIAGPGTGKTQILAARIGKILLETDALPENILCLTYTDAGAIAMRRRLQQFIGADAYQVNIYTFHAFCNDVIQDNLSLFEKTALDPISDLEAIQLFKQLIDTLPKNHPLKRYRGDVYFEVSNLRSLFSSMKREGWTPEFLCSRIDEYLQSLPARDEFIYKRKYKQFNAGDLKQEKIDEENIKMEKLRAAVLEFPRYQQLMKQRNRYDFDDMINWVISVFEENRALLAAYQEKFQYILVDEYQDTSGTQNRLVQLLISYWDKPNVFVVGDDDQSIYRFQGANVENMLSFAEAYVNELKTVVLTSNYRSIQPILDISKTLINRNEERLVKQLPGLSKELLAANATINHLTHPPVITEYQSVKEEMAGICGQVKKLLENGKVPGRIAVIYKENKFGEELAAYLRLSAVPVYSKRSINILQLPFVRKLLQLLRYLQAEHDIPYGGDELLFEILHYDFYRIPPMVIARLTAEMNRLRNNGETTSLRRHLYDQANTAPKSLFDNGPHEGLRTVSAFLEQLIADLPNVSLLQLTENLIRNAGVLGYVMKQPDKIALMQQLTALFDFIKEECARNPTLTLSGLIGIIDLMEKEDLPLPMIQVSGSENGVNLLTAHGSKGLEFEYVFIAGANAAWWEKKRKPGGGYKLPDTLFSSTAGNPARDLEELRRLFYVALTRAEQHLHISFARYRNDGREMEPSVFIAEILEQHSLPVEKAVITPDDMAAFQSLQFTAQAPEIEAAEANFITPLLERFIMNVTALNSYLKCPLGFYYQNLIRIPSGKNEATAFGSAVHHALEKMFRRMQESGTDTFPPAETLVEDFRWYMQRHRENFTPEAYKRRMEYGEDILPRYYQQYAAQWNRIVSVERNIRGVQVNGIPLKGKLDKLEFTGKEINVVDYKTGDFDKAVSKMKGPDDKDPLGGDYWRQAVFYKLLLDNYEQKDWKVVSTEFDFVEPDNKKQYRKQKITITPQDIETVTRQLTEVWNRIQARDFYTGCGKEDCHWCSFVKDNRLEVALHDLETEDESA